MALEETNVVDDLDSFQPIVHNVVAMALTTSIAVDLNSIIVVSVYGLMDSTNEEINAIQALVVAIVFNVGHLASIETMADSN